MNRHSNVLPATCILLALVFFGITLSSCAPTVNAIRHRKLQTGAKMSHSIFLDPVALDQNKTVFVKVTNTSQMQELNFRKHLEKELKDKGFDVVSRPIDAGYIIQANVRYMDFWKADMADSASVVGGLGGALAGISLGHGTGGKTAAGLIAGAAGAVGGAVLGTMVHVDTFIGIVDVLIKERVPGGFSGEVSTNLKQGESTTLKATRKIKLDYQTYQTKILAFARQTNIDRKEAADTLSYILAAEIGGFFLR